MRIGELKGRLGLFSLLLGNCPSKTNILLDFKILNSKATRTIQSTKKHRQVSTRTLKTCEIPKICRKGEGEGEGKLLA